MKNLFYLIAFFSHLVFSNGTPPYINVNTLFSDIIISQDFKGWTLAGKGLGELAVWPRTNVRQEELSKLSNGYSPTVAPINVKPLLLNNESKEFFEGVEDNFDGSKIGYKYYFFPQSVLNTKIYTDIGEPISFYLIKKIPDNFDLNTDATPAPSLEEEKNWINQQIDLNIGFKQGSIKYDQKEYSEARNLFYKGSQLGHSDSQYWYGRMLFNGTGGEEDLPGARKYLKLAADQGISEAQYLYADMLSWGHGGDKDREGAKKYYKLSADQGDYEAQFHYASMLRYPDEGGEKDLPEARKYLKLSADQGYVFAQYIYAMMLLKGEGGEKDLEGAKKYLKLAADLGDNRARIEYEKLTSD